MGGWGGGGICNVNSHTCVVYMGDRCISVYGMATALIKSALNSVLEKTPSESPRSVNVRKWAIQILEKSIHTEKQMDVFDKFSSEIMRYFRQLVQIAATRYKLAALFVIFNE